MYVCMYVPTTTVTVGNMGATTAMELYSSCENGCEGNRRANIMKLCTISLSYYCYMSILLLIMGEFGGFHTFVSVVVDDDSAELFVDELSLLLEAVLPVELNPFLDCIV